MRAPNPEGVEELVGFPVPSSIVAFYKRWPHLEKTEYYLINPKTGASWFIGGFVPLSRIDVREALRTFRTSGLPIADDLDKGIYSISPQGQIELWSPNLPSGHSLVAESIDQLMRYRIAEAEEIHADVDA